MVEGVRTDVGESTTAFVDGQKTVFWVVSSVVPCLTMIRTNVHDEVYTAYQTPAEVSINRTLILEKKCRLPLSKKAQNQLIICTDRIQMP